MHLAELAQKNRRVKFWKELLIDCALTDAQKSEVQENLNLFQELLTRMLKDGMASAGVIPEQDNIKMINLERKLEQLAEAARLEAGKSILLT